MYPNTCVTYVTGMYPLGDSGNEIGFAYAQELFVETFVVHQHKLAARRRRASLRF